MGILGGERDPSGFRPRVLPPVWAGLVAAAMWGAARLCGSWPLPAAGATLHTMLVMGGAATCAAGAGLAAWAVAGFVRHGTPIEPGRVSTALITGGAFRVSRNPIYAGMLLLLTGWVLILGSPVTIFGPAMFVAVISRRIIVREEAMLTEAFGPVYAAYAARVRRWI